MTASITITFTYSDNNFSDLTAVPCPDPKWLHITVEGEHAITQILLPTIPLKSLANTDWGTWITTIQGLVMGCCDITATQHQLLLDIMLIYRAFTSGTVGVADIWYTNFVHTLINIARSHPENQSIDTALTYLTSALCVLLPRTIFDSPDIPSITHDPKPAADAPNLHSVPSGGSASASAFMISPPLDGIPTPSPLLDGIYSAVLHQSADEGYDSNEETMPSLHTIYDSSDNDM